MDRVHSKYKHIIKSIYHSSLQVTKYTSAHKIHKILEYVLVSTNY